MDQFCPDTREPQDEDELGMPPLIVAPVAAAASPWMLLRFDIVPREVLSGCRRAARRPAPHQHATRTLKAAVRALLSPDGGYQHDSLRCVARRPWSGGEEAWCRIRTTDLEGVCYALSAPVNDAMCSLFGVAVVVNTADCSRERRRSHRHSIQPVPFRRRLVAPAPPPPSPPNLAKEAARTGASFLLRARRRGGRLDHDDVRRAVAAWVEGYAECWEDWEVEAVVDVLCIVSNSSPSNALCWSKTLHAWEGWYSVGCVPLPRDPPPPPAPSLHPVPSPPRPPAPPLPSPPPPRHQSRANRRHRGSSPLRLDDPSLRDPVERVEVAMRALSGGRVVCYPAGVLGLVGCMIPHVSLDVCDRILGRAKVKWPDWWEVECVPPPSSSGPTRAASAAAPASVAGLVAKWGAAHVGWVVRAGGAWWKAGSEWLVRWSF